MINQFETIISALIQPGDSEDTFYLLDPKKHFHEERTDDASIAQNLNASFLITLAGSKHPASKQAKQYLTHMLDSPAWGYAAKFYLNGIRLIHQEIETLCQQDSEFSNRLRGLSEWIAGGISRDNTEEAAEKIWSVFFPEATGILEDKQGCQDSLRNKRAVKITAPSTNPICNPAQEILFTSNVLFTLPQASKSIDDLPLSESIKKKLHQAISEPQLFWYDHPIQIGIEPEKNEVLHGLSGLSQALEFEKRYGNALPDARLKCLLSVSVTHRGIHDLVKKYLEDELSRFSSLSNIDVYLFTEADTRRLIEEVLTPAAKSYLRHTHPGELFEVFGVDGEYGRHYSFLKAVAALWSILIQPEVKATFKIDLDQTFPQEKLMQETGASAFDHFKTPLWGASGFDDYGQPVELGMIAGFLVNAADIEKSLFTPDVKYPNRAFDPDEFIFFSTLPQACSTEAEMMTRYNSNKFDGVQTCIQRVHVTGGTNRPFTPSFIGRAEDQAYILSVFPNESKKLAYVHKDGLVMSHNKEMFAQEAIRSAHVGKLIGDYIRILYFSAYARAITNDIAALKNFQDPFTGCFISKIPTTVVYLRFALKAASFYNSDQENEGFEFIENGAKRILDALDFIQGENSMLKQAYEKEHLGWNLYYDTLSAIERMLDRGDEFALKLREKAQGIINECHVKLRS
ncbi:MAG: hypothetical protein JRJ73_12945 [Deltaproteobacteria bacterium]|nr:hypothetical protein [Deltaproteobacteria bacterium]